MINRLREYEPKRHVPSVAEVSEMMHLDHAVKSMATAIARKPIPALAVALLVGVTAGWLLKRR